VKGKDLRIISKILRRGVYPERDSSVASLLRMTKSEGLLRMTKSEGLLRMTKSEGLLRMTEPEAPQNDKERRASLE
jgi:hypothetical protein